MKQKIEIEVDVPDGWDVTGYRAVEFGETYIGWPGVAVKWPNNYPSTAEAFILRRCEPVRESRWENVYPLYEGGLKGVYINRCLADGCAQGTRLGVIRLDYEDGKLVRVELEEVSDETKS